MAKWNRVLVGKIDLDTVGAAHLLGVTREDQVVVLRNCHASEEDLADPAVLCVEVGGSGRVAEGNFDHHEEGGPTASATLQAAQQIHPICSGCLTEGAMSYCYSDCSISSGLEVGSMAWHLGLANLVSYIDQIDTQGAEALRHQTEGVQFPALSDVFAGILLSERDPVEQLHKGVELFAAVVQRGLNPFEETVAGFDSYAEAKAENNRQVALAVERAQWVTTAAGRRLAFLETDFFGAPGALYGAGAEIAVAYSPHFGNPPVPKFTVAGNGVKVDSALPALNALEEGWGGPATGMIIGSPRSGSKLTLEQVVSVVSEAC